MKFNKDVFKNWKFYLLVAGVVIVGTLSYLNTKDKKYDITYPNELVFEYGEDLTKKISVSNADKLEITVVDKEKNQVKDIKLGEPYTLEITVFDKDNKTVLYKEGALFKDTVEPIITVLKDELDVEINSSVLNIESSATDNYDKEIKTEVDLSQIDLTKEGLYVAYITAKDSSNNTNKKEVKVNVIKPKEADKVSNTGTIKVPATSGNVNNTTTTNTNNTPAQGTTGSTAQTNTQSKPSNTTTPAPKPEKTQEQIAAEQAEAKRKAEIEQAKKHCADTYGTWNGSSCSWTPVEQPAQPQQPSEPQQPAQPSGGRDDGCSVSAKIAEYEVYAQGYIAEHGGAWQKTYDPESGQLRLSVHMGDGRGIPETRREFYCKQP